MAFRFRSGLGVLGVGIKRIGGSGFKDFGFEGVPLRVLFSAFKGSIRVTKGSVWVPWPFVIGLGGIPYIPDQ